MEWTAELTAVLGVSVATLGYVGRGAIDALGKRLGDEKHQELLQKMEAFQSSLDSHISDDEREQVQMNVSLNSVRTDIARLLERWQ